MSGPLFLAVVAFVVWYFWKHPRAWLRFRAMLRMPRRGASLPQVSASSAAAVLGILFAVLALWLWWVPIVAFLRSPFGSFPATISTWFVPAAIFLAVVALLSFPLKKWEKQLRGFAFSAFVVILGIAGLMVWAGYPLTHQEGLKIQADIPRAELPEATWRPVYLAPGAESELIEIPIYTRPRIAGDSVLLIQEFKGGGACEFHRCPAEGNYKGFRIRNLLQTQRNSARYAFVNG